MKKHSKLARLASLGVLLFVTLIAIQKLGKPAFATGLVGKEDLSGPWQMTIIGQTGCGFGTTLYNFTLNGSGSSSNVTGVSHTAACGDSTSTGNSFTILTMNTNGSGTAGLTCGAGCGWTLNIQVAPDRSTFNVIDVSPLNSGQFIAGVAVHQ